MRITLVAIGTRGDVQPMIALGKGLAAAGHGVSMIAGSNFAGWVENHGLRFVPTVDMEALMGGEHGVAWSQGSDNPLRQIRAMRDLMEEAGGPMTEPIQAVASSSDLLVASFSAQPLVQSASEASGVPYINALLQPQYPTTSGAAALTPVFPGRRSRANRWMGLLAERIIWWIVAGTTNRYRARLGLRAHSAGSFRRVNHRAPAVMGFSRHVVPPSTDWPGAPILAGYWFLDEETGSTPRDGLSDFLGAGSPPVYIGFGSMSNRAPGRTLALILEAVKRSGQRAVIASGWGDLRGGDLPAEVRLVRGAPHHWLFPRVAGVVHHGGAGTTAAGLRAGRPTMIVPHMSDQPYWGRRVHELGAGVRPVMRHRLTVESLAAGLDQLARDTRIRDGAAALGEKIRAERGVEAAVAAIEALMKDQARGAR